MSLNVAGIASSPRRWGFGPELLHAYRKDAGLAKKDLARRAGLSPSMVARIEAGTLQPTDEQVLALAGALDVDDWALCWA